MVIAGPKSDLLEPEIDKLKAYLAKGGKLLVLLDPPQNADAPPLTNLLALLKDWSVEVGNNAVLDPMSQLRGAEADVPVAAPPIRLTPITNTFRMLTAYPYADRSSRSKARRPAAPPRRSSRAAATAGPKADLKPLTTKGEASPDLDKGDVQGPVSLAVAVSAPVDGATPPPPADGQDANPNKPETRLVVVGDSDFAANAVAGMAGNRDMFLNIVNWLAQQENLISVRPRDPEDRRITLTAGQDRIIFWFTVADHAGPDPPGRRADLVAEAVAMRGLRSFLLLLVVCAGARRVPVLRRVEARSASGGQEGQGLHRRSRQDRRDHGQVGVRRADDAQEDRDRLADRRSPSPPSPTAPRSRVSRATCRRSSSSASSTRTRRTSRSTVWRSRASKSRSRPAAQEHRC